MSGEQPGSAQDAAQPAGQAGPGQPPGARPRSWLFLVRPKWLGWHAFAVCAVLGMLWLGDWQLHRAESGNGLSWAYTFEWPIFAVMGIVFWAKTVLDEYRSPGVSNNLAAEPELPAGAAALSAARADARVAVRDEDDPELAAYNAYLARLNQAVQGHGKWHGLR